MRRFNFNKLIRNKIIERMHEENILVNSEKLTKSLYIESLKDKIIEEAKEVCEAKCKKSLTIELADVIEVIHSIAEVNDIHIEEIENERIKKLKINGKFSPDTYLHYIDVNENQVELIKYLENKNRHYKYDEPSNQKYI